jgi:hypothetical protein
MKMDTNGFMERSKEYSECIAKYIGTAKPDPEKMAKRTNFAIRTQMTMVTALLKSSGMSNGETLMAVIMIADNILDRLHSEKESEDKTG